MLQVTQYCAETRDLDSADFDLLLFLDPDSTMLFKMTDNASGSGMGTSGLVGQFMTWQDMSGVNDPGMLLLKIVLLHFVLPAVLTLLFAFFMRKKGWIQDGDMKLSDS